PASTPPRPPTESPTGGGLGPNESVTGPPRAWGALGAPPCSMAPQGPSERPYAIRPERSALRDPPPRRAPPRRAPARRPLPTLRRTPTEAPWIPRRVRIHSSKCTKKFPPTPWGRPGDSPLDSRVDPWGSLGTPDASFPTSSPPVPGSPPGQKLENVNDCG